MVILLTILTVCGTLSILIWLGIALHPARPWDMWPVAEDMPSPPDPDTWPAVAILVPARNEAGSLPDTLPALLQQDYPGPFQVLLMDDRSDDGTAGVAEKMAIDLGCAEKLRVLKGEPLPEGWVGKVWALEQGRRSMPSTGSAAPRRILLTDADIRHAPDSLRRLVAESEGDNLALNSRMARLRCVSFAEKLLIPPFVFFFNLLYPMRRVNRAEDRLAAAAGGCVLLDREALETAGGFACIQGEIIDDVNLARAIKKDGRRIRLALSRGEVESLRAYETLGAIWKMVRRTAFTELRYSYLRLALAMAGLALTFLMPLLLLLFGLAWGGFALATGLPPGTWMYAGVLALKGLFALAVMALIYRPATQFFGLSALWSWTLPVAGILYGAMTLDSALRSLTGLQRGWR